jgi:hypothetical protein
MDKETPKKHGLQIVLERNQFYWDSYRSLSLNVILLIFIFILTSIFALYQRATFPAPLYFGTTPDGRPIPVVDLTQAFWTTDELMTWATQAIKKMYSYDFVTWRTVLQSSQEYFTNKGYVDFKVALQESRNMESVRVNKQVVSAEVTGPGVLKRQGRLSSAAPYSWDIEMPVTITYQNSQNKVIRQSGTLALTINRSSTLRHPGGLAIDQLVLIAQ